MPSENIAAAFIDPDIIFKDQTGGSVSSPLKIDITKGQVDQYSVGSMIYPDDLMGDNNQYGGNYVIFYINVHEDSYLVKGNKVSVVDGRAIQSLQSANRRLTSEEATDATVIGGGLGGSLLSIIPGLGGKSVLTKTVAGALLAGGAIDIAGGAKKEYKQMKEVIALHVPNEINVRYSMQWEGDAQAGAQALGSIAENTWEALKNRNLTSIQDAGKTGASYLTGVALQTQGAGQLLAKSAGVTGNPKKEQLFQEVDFRSFTFNYQFFPRSAKEASIVRKIITAFKLHMHPEYKADTGQFLYIYPSEFDIMYYQNGRENTNLFKHTSCVLTDMSISYSPQGQFSTFKDGMPTQININLTFKELALLSKREIDLGY